MLTANSYGRFSETLWSSNVHVQLVAGTAAIDADASTFHFPNVTCCTHTSTAFLSHCLTDVAVRFTHTHTLHFGQVLHQFCYCCYCRCCNLLDKSFVVFAHTLEQHVSSSCSSSSAPTKDLASLRVATVVVNETRWCCCCYVCCCLNKFLFK